MSTETQTSYTISCPDCDLLLSAALPAKGHSHHCPRCGKELLKASENSILKTAVLSLTALILYIPALFLPLLTISTLGLSDTGSIVDSIVIMFQDGYFFVGIATFLFAAFFPIALFLFLLFISLSLMKGGKKPRLLAKMFRFYCHIEEWAMGEVYLLGIIVSLIKMKDMGDIQYDYGFFFFLTVVIVTVFLHGVLDKRVFWEAMSASEPLPDQGNTLSTAKAQGLILCMDCYRLHPKSEEGGKCTRCGAHLSTRKADSLNRTTALVCTALLFLFPANLLPIMRVDFLGSIAPSTILDGIIYFFQSGSYFVGGIILIASILVPVYKVVGLSILLCSIYFNKPYHLRKKAVMFRCIAFIGRWSMLDIFVIAILAALVNFGFVSSVTAAGAATYFCGVVVLTMAATITFDPRLLWDNSQSQTNIESYEHQS